MSAPGFADWDEFDTMASTSRDFASFPVVCIMVWAFILSAAGSFAYALFCIAHRRDGSAFLAFSWGALALKAALDLAKRERAS